MEPVTIPALHDHLPRVLAAVEAGRHVVLTRDGREIADIIPRGTPPAGTARERILHELAEGAASDRTLRDDLDALLAELSDDVA